MNAPATFLGPVDQLPPEGAEPSPTASSEVECCASLFADSAIAFHVSRDGVTVRSNPQETERFQRFDLALPASEDTPSLSWKEEAFEIRFQDLFRESEAFATLSDASEPEDYVRRFLESLASSLDDPALEHDGAIVPLIQWQPDDDGQSAVVRLYGLLLADEEQFERFRRSQNDGLGLIFEDAEIEGHGVRETVTALALLGITLGSTMQADAGLFDNLRERREAKRQEARQEAIEERRAVRRAEAPVRPSTERTGWQDAHDDAYINHRLLENSDGAQKKVIIDIDRQRAYLLVDDAIAIDSAVSTARTGKHTPRGEFEITQRVRTGKTSTIYGSDMPYWQRLDQTAIGIHTGDLPGYPASAGCIRLPYTVAPVLFDHTASGTTVEVVDTWNGEELHEDVQRNDGMLVARVVEEEAES